MKKQKPTEPATEQTEQVQQEVQQPSLQEELARLAEENEQLRAEKEKLQRSVESMKAMVEKADSYLNQLVAMKNDFESYKRRMKFNAEQARQEGVQSVALKLIEIADTFEIARKHLTDETLKAFDMVYQQLMSVLNGLGIEQMQVVGQEFDHMTMNALSQMDFGEQNKGKVVEVYKNGYKMDEKVLRYAEVIVGA